MSSSSLQESSSPSWFIILLFAASAFIFNTTEFVPIGLLPLIADSLQVPESQTGLLMTIYAWAVTILSLPLTLATTRIERKKLLLSLFLLFAIAHIVSALSTSYYMLMFSRLLVACAHAVFWSITIPLAVRLAPNQEKNKALALMVTGSALATVLGVPLGTAIGQHIGWRMTFYVISGIAALIMLMLFRRLPTLPSQNAGDLSSLPSLFRRATLMQAFLLTALTITGYFTAYTYITPYLREIGGFEPSFVIWVLFVMGSAGIVGSMIFTRLSRYTEIHTYTLGATLLILCLLSLSVVRGQMIAMLLLALVWGIAVTLIVMNVQAKVLEAASDAADIATAMFSATFNIGIGGGAFVGSMVLKHSDISYVTIVGAGFIGIALLFFLLVSRHIWILSNEKKE